MTLKDLLQEVEHYNKTDTPFTLEELHEVLSNHSTHAETIAIDILDTFRGITIY